jgi:protein-disulfide isomerase
MSELTFNPWTEKSNLMAMSAVLVVAGFSVGRLDASSRAPAAQAAPAAIAPAEPAPEMPTAAPAPAAAAAPTPAPSPSPAPSAAAAAPKPSSGLDSQTDEGAGKNVDLAKMATSPKGVESPFLGAKDALVVVNVYSDFQCPVCKRSADPIKQLVADFPGKVRVYFRHNALEMHGRSKPSAIASIAAKRQGKFWEYHDKLFQTGQLDDSSLRQAATDLGLDMAQFDKDLADPAIAARVDEESKWANAMGATGTPGFFVNGVRQVGWGSYLALKSIVQREIDKGEELLASGTPRDQVIAKRVAALADKNTKGEGEAAIDVAKWAEYLTKN